MPIVRGRGVVRYWLAALLAGASIVVLGCGGEAEPAAAPAAPREAAPSSEQPVVLFLGTMLRGQDAGALRDNLREILRRTRVTHPDVRFLVAGMRAAPNLGAAYVRGFETVYVELAEEFGAARIPFLLDGVAGDPELNLPDGIHPTAEGHRLLAATVWASLEPLLH